MKIKPKGVTFDLNLSSTNDRVSPPCRKETNLSLNDSDSGVGSQNTSGAGLMSQDFGDEFDGEFQTSGAGTSCYFANYCQIDSDSNVSCSP